jgi:hypothetical protein
VSRAALLSGLLVALGFLQMLGLGAGLPGLRAAGFATAASPLPLVFSVFKGAETFAAEFQVEAWTGSGQVIRRTITPELYGRLAGPYNRRNAYGVLFSHGPLFDNPGLIALRQNALRYGFRPGGPLAREFGLPPDLQRLHIIVRSRSRGDSRVWTVEVPCAP